MNIIDKNLYYIGGVVRDELLGKKSFDIDLTYVGNAIEFAKTIPNAKIIQINEPFGTVKIKIDNEEIDIASTRDEIYPQKGHLPKVKNIGCSLKEDVLRRDFTINAMAKSTLTGEIIDYTGGLNDIKTKTLRVLHDNSFIDDPTRIIRGLKFSIRFGFELDKHTQKLQNEYLNNVNYDMSHKRLLKELKETFNLNSQKAFEKFVRENIYKLVTPKKFSLPEVNFEKLIDKHQPKNIWIIYAGQIPDIEKLPLTKIETQIIKDYYKLQTKSYNNDFEVYKNFTCVNLESVIMFAGVNYNAAIRYLDKLKNIKLEITGNDIQSLGIKPSIKYQECFDFILKEKINKPSISKQDELNLARQFFAKSQSNGVC